MQVSCIVAHVPAGALHFSRHIRARLVEDATRALRGCARGLISDTSWAGRRQTPRTCVALVAAGAGALAPPASGTASLWSLRQRPSAALEYPPRSYSPPPRRRAAAVVVAASPLRPRPCRRRRSPCRRRPRRCSRRRSSGSLRPLRVHPAGGAFCRGTLWRWRGRRGGRGGRDPVDARDRLLAGGKVECIT